MIELTDEQLWESAHEHVRTERSSSVKVILSLLEIDRRELHLDRAFKSLAILCMDEFKYSKTAAYDRVSCVDLIRELPELEEMLIEGSISMTVAKMLRSFFEAEAKLGHIYSRDQKSAFLKQLQNMSCRAVERLFAELRPDLIAQERTRYISGDRVEMKVILPVEDYEGLERLKDLLSHSHPSMTNGELVIKMKEDSLNRIDPLRKQKAKAERIEKNHPPAAEKTEKFRAPGKSGQPARMHYTAAQTKKIFESYDWKGCYYVDGVSMRRCGSQRCLQKDHIIPVHLGGTNEPSNIQFLCAKHNRLRAKKEHGQRMTPRKKRDANPEKPTQP